MSEKEIIKLWKSGLTKNKLAEIYKREHNEQIKMIRLEMHNRYSGRFITNFEALAYVERVIYRYLKGGTDDRKRG